MSWLVATSISAMTRKDSSILFFLHHDLEANWSIFCNSHAINHKLHDIKEM